MNNNEVRTMKTREIILFNISMLFISVGFCLFIVFTGLKLTGDIKFSWLYVTMTLWLPLLLGVVLYLISKSIDILSKITKNINEKRNKLND